MSEGATKRYACPGAWTPMTAGDGLLIRVRGGSRALSANQVRGLARLASEHGNGLVELTRRANLQLRGLRSETLATVQAALVELGLADASPAREQRPGLLVDPLHGLVPGCASLGGLTDAIDDALALCAEDHLSSAKLGVVLDCGSGALGGVDADIRVELIDETGNDARVLVATPTGAAPLALCRSSEVSTVVAALLRELSRFSRSRTDRDASRMRDLVRVHGLAPLRACIAHLPQPVLVPLTHAATALPTLGFQRGHAPFLGVGVAFGSAPSAAWTALAELADRFGAGELRLSPAREVLLPGVRRELALSAVNDTAREHGLITHQDDPRRRVTACSGAPACISAKGETRALATALAETSPVIAAGGTLHVSGCSKACASSANASLTVVLAEGGAQLGVNTSVADTCAMPVEPLPVLRSRVERFRSERADQPAAAR